MYDQNLVEFYDRVARFEKAHAKGFGHEAAGTLGRSSLARPRRRARLRLLPLVLTLAAALLLKGAIHAFVGADDYQARVDRLAAGQGFDRLGAWLMQADPVTLRVSAAISDLRN